MAIISSLRLTCAERACRLGIQWQQEPNLPQEMRELLDQFTVYYDNQAMFLLAREAGANAVNTFTKAHGMEADYCYLRDLSRGTYEHEIICFIGMNPDALEPEKRIELIESIKSAQDIFNRLIVAAYRGDADGFECFFNANRGNYLRALDFASKAGNIDVIIERIIETNVNATDKEGNTALTWAGNREDLAARLIADGAV